MPEPSNDVWEVLSTNRSIRRFTDEPVDDATLDRCLEAATWAPNGANYQAWRFIVLRAPECSSIARASPVRDDHVAQVAGGAALRRRGLPVGDDPVDPPRGLRGGALSER